MFKRVCGVVLVLIFAVPTANARLYKWVDENGQVHYGDSIPYEYSKREHTEMSNKGVTLKKNKALPTEQELVQMRIERQKQKQEERLAKEQRQRDRVLLDTYTTERDLIAARDARIEAVESQIKLSRSIIEEARTNLDKSEKLAAALKQQKKQVPETLFTKIEREKRSLEIHKKVGNGHIEKRAQISKQFDAYIARFRELKAVQQRKRDELEAKRREALNMVH